MALQESWSNVVGWYQTGEVAALYAEYELELERVVVDDPSIIDLIVSCQQCQIRFVTAATNRRRKDLRCPMGCRQQHKKASSQERSKAYRQDEVGRTKKQELNRKRSANGRSPPSEQAPSQIIQMKSYLKFLIEVLYHRKLSESEIENLYQKIQNQLRQHTFVIQKN